MPKLFNVRHPLGYEDARPYPDNQSNYPYNKARSFTLLNVFLNTGGTQCESRIRACAPQIQSISDYYTRQLADPACLWTKSQRELAECFVREWAAVRRTLAHRDRVKPTRTCDHDLISDLYNTTGWIK